MHGPRRILRPFTIIALTVVCTGLCGVSAFGQSKDFGAKFDLFGDGKKDTAEPSKPAGPDVRVTLIPATAKPGDEVTLSIHVGVPKDAHTYSISPSFGGGSRINITAVTGLEPLGEGFAASPAPIKVYVKEFEQEVEEHESDVTWSRKYRVLPNAVSTSASITGKLNYQVCDDHGCTPYRVPIKVALELSSATPPPVAAQTASVTTSASPLQFEAKPKIRGTGTPVTVRASLTPETAKPGEEVTLALTLELESPWHTYSLTQSPGQSAVPTKIELSSLNGLKPVDRIWKPSRPFQKQMVQDGPNTLLQEVYTETVSGIL